MIAVIADDLTGAAEIAGIALGFGLRVSLYMGPGNNDPEADLVIVSTDGRSKPLDEAKLVTEASIRWLLSLHPQFIFKKTDSLLRGHVREELVLQMKMTGLDSVLLIPANPSLGRTIRQGQYLINKTPLHETPFAHDPEFPARSSMVTEILASKDVVSVGLMAELSAAGINIGDVSSSDDMSQWVKRLTSDMIPAGGGDFFSAILRSKCASVDLLSVQPRSPILFVKGSAFGDESHPVRQAAILQGEAMLIDPSMINNGPELHREWVQTAAGILTEKGMLFIGFDHLLFSPQSNPVNMRTCMADFIDAVCAICMPAELFVEGGSTAQAILDKMNISHCRPSGIWSRGVVRLDSFRLAVTVKPGSYPLPEVLIDLFT
jgi:uncharacterized protein YgbK (DUF1537 family)